MTTHPTCPGCEEHDKECVIFANGNIICTDCLREATGTMAQGYREWNEAGVKLVEKEAV